MRKLLLFMALFMSFVLTAQAGYVIRSINITADLEYFHNFTLTINGANEPISAGSMVLPATEENGIVIIQTDSNEPAYFFPVLLNEGNLFIQVRDFHYVDNSGSGYYVLCGSRGEGSNARAFVATVDVSLSWMDFYEYADANVFYSIWAENLLPPYPAVDDYYVCGAKDSFGVIASIDRASMQFTDFRSTIRVTEWEYHKIILKKNMDHTLLFVVSGRNPDCTQIGVTTFIPPFNTLVSYVWDQYTEPDSHCVVSANLSTNNSVILASSHQDRVTLNPITFPLPSLLINAYQFDFPNPTNTYLIQDIEMGIPIGGAVRPFFSVAGYTESTSSVHSAWYGSIIRFPSVIAMTNNYYFGTDDDQYKHYKIKYNRYGEIYTGGYVQDNNSVGALFSTPFKNSSCDNHDTTLVPKITTIPCDTFAFSQPLSSGPVAYLSFPAPYPMSHYECYPFKKGEAPEYAMPSPEDESDIIALQDRITLKDVPSNTNYQIYSVIGQLIQAGTTTPDISTAQLGKGVYILRLEDGKTFKFVR